MSIFGHHPEGGLEVVVDLVHVLVETSVVQQLVDEVVPRVLKYQTADQLTNQNVPIR